MSDNEDDEKRREKKKAKKEKRKSEKRRSSRRPEGNGLGDELTEELNQLANAAGGGDDSGSDIPKDSKRRSRSKSKGRKMEKKKSKRSMKDSSSDHSRQTNADDSVGSAPSTPKDSSTSSRRSVRKGKKRSGSVSGSGNGNGNGNGVDDSNHSTGSSRRRNSEMMRRQSLAIPLEEGGGDDLRESASPRVKGKPKIPKKHLRGSKKPTTSSDDDDDDGNNDGNDGAPVLPELDNGFDANDDGFDLMSPIPTSSSSSRRTKKKLKKESKKKKKKTKRIGGGSGGGSASSSRHSMLDMDDDDDDDDENNDASEFGGDGDDNDDNNNKITSVEEKLIEKLANDLTLLEDEDTTNNNDDDDDDDDGDDTDPDFDRDEFDVSIREVGGSKSERMESMASLSTSSAEGDSSKPSSNKVIKFSEEYFANILRDVQEACIAAISLEIEDVNPFVDACGSFYDAWYYNWENEQYLQEMIERKATKAEIEEAQAYVDESHQSLPKAKKFAIRRAIKIFEKLDENKIAALEKVLVKGSIVSQMSPKGLAKFASGSEEKQKLITQLFSNPKLMKEMVRNGGAVKSRYGRAMEIYVECTKDKDSWPEGFERVNKKIALACALELCGSVYEFDSTVKIDPIERYKHFEEAHRLGELDPAFPHFSVWEMRQIVNCDGPNEQMKWCRDMVMNYAPHITFITDPKMRYVYICDSDVRIRKPTWTGRPRTYPMVLSGGGNQSVNSWFGRFVLKSFGLPAWGSKLRRQEGYTRWTPTGWEAMGGADWDTCEWQGKTGRDFKIETEARCKAPPNEYFLKLVTLQCLADVIDCDPSSIPEYERDTLHPERFWRSMSIVSMELLFQTEPAVKRTFERTGKSLVKTRIEEYFEEYDKDLPDDPVTVEHDIITIPAGNHGYATGNLMVIDTYGGGKHLLFMADGLVDYEIPDGIPDSKSSYSMALEICTVSSKQHPLTMRYGSRGNEKTIQLQVPYTIGEWKLSENLATIEDVKPGDIIRFSRPRNALGLAIKKIILS